MRQFLKGWGLRWLLVGAVLVVLLTAACGGGESPTATPRPQATATPTSPSEQRTTPTTGPGGEATATPGGETTAGPISVDVYIEPQNFSEVPIKLKAGDKVAFSFSSLERGVGGLQPSPKPIALVVLNPVGGRVLTQQPIESAKLELTAEVTGEYKFVFDNTASRLTGRSVSFQYSITPK